MYELRVKDYPNVKKKKKKNSVILQPTLNIPAQVIKKDVHVNTKQKKAKVATLISDTVEFRTIKFTGAKEIT